MHKSFGFNADGFPQTTVAYTAIADAAVTLEDMLVDTINSNARAAVMAVFSVEDESLRVCFDGTATTSLGHLRTDGETFQVSSKDAMDNMTLINAGAGSNFTVMITVFYERA